MSHENELIQKRFMPAEVKIDAKKSKIGGYATPYGVETTIGGWFIESLQQGAATKTIRDNDIRSTFNHNADKIIGRSKIPGKPATLRLSEDSKGLLFEVDLPDTTYANDLRESIDRGDITGCSIWFRTIKDSWQYAKNAKELDKVKIVEIKLYELGPVTFPSYENGTYVGLRDCGTREEPELNLCRLHFLTVKESNGRILNSEERAFVKGILDKFSLETLRDAEPRQHSEAEPDIHSDAIEPEDKSTQERIESRRRLNKIILGGNNA